MALKLLFLLAFIAVSAEYAFAGFFGESSVPSMAMNHGDASPEIMHSSCMGLLNDNLNKQLAAALTYAAIKAKYAVYLEGNPEDEKLYTDVASYKYKNYKKLVKYAASRGETTTMEPLAIRDLSSCNNKFFCWKLSLKIERDLYTKVNELYKLAGEHGDVPLQMEVASLLQAHMRSINQVKGIIDKIKD